MSTRLFDKSGGYRKLDSFVLAGIVQIGTLRFCRRFLNLSNDPRGRQYDQMTQAARSGRANIIEGSERSATSKETEMRLTDVAKGSLAEVRGDYEMWLIDKGLPPWRTTSPDAQAVLAVRLDPVQLGDTDWLHVSAVHLLAQTAKFSQWLDARADDTSMANALILLADRAVQLLERQLRAQGESFREGGGFRERLTAVRVEARDASAGDAGAPVCELCGKPMRKRTAKSGKNAGQDFWGCTGYPDCRSIRPIEG
jgi:four helix bundle suffix protein